MQEKIKLALVGCGAMAELQHLPQLMKRSDVTVMALVDSNIQRAESLARKFAIPLALADYRQIIDSAIDAVILAVPHNVHALISIAFLHAGKHVLVEKPMALSTAECSDMIRTARQNKVILAVGLMRRFAPAGIFAKRIIDSGMIGQIHSFDIQDGYQYNWPITSDSFIRKQVCGGGVLMDLGAHSVDQLLWWLGDVEDLQYYDDSHGGVEAEAKAYLKIKSGAKGTLELSRTRDLRNTAIFHGEKAELEVALVNNEIALRPHGSATELSGPLRLLYNKEHIKQATTALVVAEHNDFFNAIKSGTKPLISGEEGMRSIAVIEKCYQNRQELVFPWVDHLEYEEVAQ